ncbi:sulfur carrier protein ThiS [Actinomadura flavalba]|uniref:sulfur carrier protein ThiS n=1 Tax=Actinomadura flavalba TaxID=1120938 RepID=UPI000367FFBF|nr:sulfur carrier protein ThiS [Actinomadura flavalba]
MTGSDITVHINGQPFDLPSGSTLGDLADRLDAPWDQVSLEIDHQIVPRDLWPSHRLKAGEHIDVVTIAPGG